MNRKPKAGLLPLYLKLYDDTRPQIRKDFDGFLHQIAAGLRSRGIDVDAASVCRVEDEFRKAVAGFERAGVDAILTVHLAYSPSLESIGALAGTDLPIVILDTTMDAAFDQTVAPARIMYNHGVHGVMDLACMLRRRKKTFDIVAGHVGDRRVLDRAADAVRGAVAARWFRTTRALRIGESFQGMGDFAVDGAVMKRRLGIAVEQIGIRELGAYVRRVTAAEVKVEVAADRKAFDCRVPLVVHEASVRVALGVRKKLEAGGFRAFSMNFLAFDTARGPVDRVPFIEASKGMARGIGYAGEGDVLTAAMVGALIRGFGDATFTEIFCPDWKGNSLFLSHMGEVNPRVAAAKPLMKEYKFTFTPAANPAVITCAPRPGPGVFVDLAPGPDERFTLIVAPVTILKDTKREDLKGSVRGWIRPVSCKVSDFLEAYGRAGGTHHSALVLGEKAGGILAFARMAGLETCVI